MQELRDPSRSFLAVLLAVLLPLCCCSIRGLAGGGFGPGGMPGDSWAESDGPRGSCCGESAHRGSGSSEGPDDRRDRETPDEPCACGKLKTASSLEKSERVSFDPSLSVVLTVLASSALWHEPLVHHAPMRDREAGVCRPATALLRLHCALIV